MTEFFFALLFVTADGPGKMHINPQPMTYEECAARSKQWAENEPFRHARTVPFCSSSLEALQSLSEDTNQ